MSDPRARPSPRAVAVEALVRIEEGAFANLIVPALLAEAGLAERDRHFVTELAYGATRMRRACDWLVDRFLARPVEPAVRAALRLGAYQLAFLGTPPHAAVSATVEAAPSRARGLVNAVLRKVACSLPVRWPDLQTELSYPDWIVARLWADLGPEDARGALEAMNRTGRVTVRPDGYVQDLASQWVAEQVGVEPGQRVADLCAAPGGKATAMAEAGPKVVVAADVDAGRAQLVAENLERLGLGNLAVVVADGRRPPLAPRSLDRVLVDAPCSGLGVLHRRPDARWRVRRHDLERLATLQRDLLDAAATLVAPGGLVVYSVCTLTAAETTGVDRWVAGAHPELEAQPPPGEPWRRWGRGALLPPQVAGTDGMFLLRLSLVPPDHGRAVPATASARQRH